MLRDVFLWRLIKIERSNLWVSVVVFILIILFGANICLSSKGLSRKEAEKIKGKLDAILMQFKEVYQVPGIVLGEEPRLPRQSAAIPVGRAILKDGSEAAVRLYMDLKKEHASEYYFSEKYLALLGAQLFKAEHLDESIAIFKLVVSEYPLSWNAYDNLGEALRKKGDNEKALESYQKALELNPNNTQETQDAYKLQLEAIEVLKALIEKK